MHTSNEKVSGKKQGNYIGLPQKGQEHVADLQLNVLTTNTVIRTAIKGQKQVTDLQLNAHTSLIHFVQLHNNEMN